jgi:hypothetical protein
MTFGFLSKKTANKDREQLGGAEVVAPNCPLQQTRPATLLPRSSQRTQAAQQLIFSVRRF